MKSPARTIFSAVAGLGLAAFTVISAFAGGFNGTSTVVAFSLLAVYGIFEIALLSYAAPRYEARPLRPRPVLVRGNRGIAMSHREDDYRRAA